MSRLEKALEKALKMRESLRDSVASESMKPQPLNHTRGHGTTLADGLFTLPRFEPGPPVIDAAKVDEHVICITAPRSDAAEQYKKLRARILNATSKNFKNTIMITSSDTNEGKTLTAINLAVSIAHEIDNTVLLVDADLRNPSVHKYLGIEPELGLSDYLKRNVALSDVLIKTGIGNLVVLPAGVPPRNPAELLSSEKMGRLVQEMKNRYKDRYIIFDSTPVLVTADALSLSRHMDGILFVIQAAHTPRKAAMQVLSLMKDCTVLGTVLNNVPSYLSKNLYPYYSRYGKRGYGGETGDSGSEVEN